MTASKCCIIPLDKEKGGWPSHLSPWTISSESMCKGLARRDVMAGAINWQARDPGLSIKGSETVVSNLRCF